jgi:hypothetical protein
MQILPIGIQTFEKIREVNMLYVDKTRQIHHLITSGFYYSLSRPRRFGKSLTLSTIKCIYEGKKDLFKGLWIEDQWDWSQTNPVVHIQFNNIGYLETGLEHALSDTLKNQATAHGIVLERQGHGQQLDELLQKLSTKTGRRVVLLIDEYDKPLIDYLEKDQLPTAFEHQRILKAFYGVIKSADPYIQFLMITGVSKFSKVSIFSDLNHLADITTHPKFSDLVGYTQIELEQTFGAWIDKTLAEHPEHTRETLLEEIRQWYNGYNWRGPHSVYNPFSILNFFSTGNFEDFWFKTGTPSFLIKKLKEAQYFNLNNLQASTALMESYTLDNLEVRSLLFQTGYLTIRNYDQTLGLYTLDYPNREVEQALTNHLIGALLHRASADSISPVLLLREAFMSNNIEQAMFVINAMLKDVPSQLFQDSGERFYHALVHLHFRYLGLFLQSEVHTSDGRMDAVVQTPTHVYILEFKIDKSETTALKQIVDKRYADRYRSEGKQIVGIGIGFSTVQRSLKGWKKKVL